MLFEAHDRTELVVGGVVQSVDVESAGGREYWPAMLPDRRPARTLLLGAGGGTLAALLLRRFGDVRVLAVDDDPRVVALGRERFYLREPVEVMIADAFAFVDACSGRFDYIGVDLFRGGERPREMLGRPFLRALARLAAPGAVIAFNLFRDRRVEVAVGRIGRVLSVTRRVEAGKNVVVHCRAR